MKKQNCLLLILALALVLLLLVALAVRLTKVSSDPADTTGSTMAGSSPTQTGTEGTSGTEASDPEPTESDPPPTETDPPPPTEPNNEYIGTLYTRAELEAMDTREYGYGPGKSTGGKRAPYAVSEQTKYAKYGANFIAPDNGNIYLTFDCGYEYTATDENGQKYRVTERILDVLKEKNVKAVFFVTMDYVKEAPDLVQRMIDEGHAVGNHSNNHPVMPQQTIDKMVYEVMSLHDYVLEHFGYKMTLFRPPTGAFSVQSLAVVQSLGYKNVHWSFAYVDWETNNQPNVNSALNNVKNSAHSGAIYLLHAVSTTNAALLGDAIDHFLAEGYHLELFQ